MSETEVTPARPLMMVATDDGSEPEYASVRSKGIELAAERGCAVVLLDRSTESNMTDPYPTGVMSSERETLGADNQLSPEELESLGRGYLADQLREARAACMEAYAYLAQGTGAQAVTEAVERYQPTAVVLPASMDDKPSLMERINADTVDSLERSIDIEIILVDGDGEVVPD